MKIGLMGAMPEEIDDIKTLLSEAPYRPINTTHIGGRDYYHFQYANNDLYLVFSRWGKVASSIAATTLINHFNVEQIIFTGVAGAAATSLNIGDIVIGTQYLQHDMNAAPLFAKFYIPLTDICYFKADLALLEAAKEAVGTLLNDMSALNGLPITEFNSQPLNVYTGTIASGDQFMTDKIEVKQLTSEIDNLYAVDMESAAVAHVCHDHGIPYIAVRIISDKADGGAHIDYGNFVQQLARPMTKLIVEQLLQQLLH